MTKQEEIREGLKKLREDLRKGVLFDNDDYVIDACLFYLRSRDVVIKVDKPLPSIFDIEDNVISALKYEKKLGGYSLTEPLIIVPS